MLSNRSRVKSCNLKLLWSRCLEKRQRFHSFDKEVYIYSKYIINITLTCLLDVLQRWVESDSPLGIYLLYKRKPAIKYNWQTNEFPIQLNIKHVQTEILLQSNDIWYAKLWI